MFLLTGPPASGKTSYCLTALRECLRVRDFNCRLLVPTSTMAEHLRNQLAREGFVFPPRLITTLGRFVDELAPDLRPVSAGTLELLVGVVLASMPQGRYAGVRDFSGFRSAITKAIVEYSGAGGNTSHLHLTDPEFASVYEAVTAELKRRRLYLRAQRLEHAATQAAEADLPRQIWITGFSAFTPTERALIRAVDGRSRLTLTLPDLQSASGLSGEHRTLDVRSSSSRRTLVVANTPEGEANEIAARILKEAENGRPWREMATIVRDDAMIPVLRAALDRFGIPARYYFLPSLASDPTVRYLLAIVGSAMNGWEHESTLAALRMHGSPLERAGDRWEYKVREELPGRGLDGLRVPAPEWTQSFFDELDKLTAWATERHTPAAWAFRFASLPALFRPAPITDGVRPDLWRSQAGSLDAFAAAVEEAAGILSPEPTDCREFLDALQTVLQSASVRMIDRRRDVVHVIDAMEARQWRVPVVFIAGLLEGRFPRHHSENPILPDDVRLRLRRAGVEMKTAADRQADEQALFDLAMTRATDHTLLSYARLNAKGEANLPSFLLERAKPYAEELALPVRPKPLRQRAPEPAAVIKSMDVLEALAAKHGRLSASAIETYTACPYSFFGERSLGLKRPPANPYDRLNAMLQGSIAHKAFEWHFRDGIPIRDAFGQAFAEGCKENRVPPGYRTEAIRLELLHGVLLLTADQRVQTRGARSLFEKEFSFVLEDGTIISGRIDRVEIDQNGNALIFDYKYRRGYRMKDTRTENQNGERVQTGMYLLGARRMELTPVGMAYWGFKKEVSVVGWVLDSHYPDLKIPCKEEDLVEVIANARETALRAASDIRSGRIAPDPADVDRCQWCDFVHMCRYEVREAAQTAGGQDGA